MHMADLTERFGTMVFSEDVMKKWLPKDVYKQLAATIEGGEPLDLDVANAVAHAMKAVSYTHLDVYKRQLFPCASKRPLIYR